jgi:glutamyl-tRNA reductase
MLISLALDHRRVDLRTLEQVQLSADRVRTIYRAQRRLGGQVFLLGTCNRLELTAWVPDGDLRQAVRLTGYLVRRLAPSPLMADQFLARARLRVEEEAVGHLLRVAAGLESRITGDAQILGQVRAAYRVADQHGRLGGELHRLLQTALRVGRRVRTESGLVHQEASAGSLAAALIARRLGPLEGRALVVLGAGKTAALTARRLALRGANRITLVNRTFERAVSLARELDAAAAPWSQREWHLASAEAAVVATSAAEWIVCRDALRAARAEAAAGDRPLLVVDLGLPRNVEPAVAELRGITLTDLDDIGAGRGMAGATEADRRTAERIVAEEQARLAAWRRRQEVRVRAVG